MTDKILNCPTAFRVPHWIPPQPSLGQALRGDDVLFSTHLRLDARPSPSWMMQRVDKPTLREQALPCDSPPGEIAHAGSA